MNPRPKDKWKEKPENLIPVQQYRTNYLSQTKKKGKLTSKKQTYNGNKYDSTFEAKVAEELDWQLKAGDLVAVQRQVKMPLIVNGVLVCTYYVDFKTVDKHGQVNYVEAKGFSTQLWILKKKLFCALLPILDPGATYQVIKQ
jgi:hypothetical protein